MLREAARAAQTAQHAAHLQLLRELELVKVVVALDGGVERSVVVLRDVELVRGLVDARQIVLLYGEEVVLDDAEVAATADQRHDAGVVDAPLQHLQPAHTHTSSPHSKSKVSWRHVHRSHRLNLTPDPDVDSLWQFQR